MTLMTMKRDDSLNLIPAYALDALDEDERAEVDTLLATDTEAQQLLADYQAVASTLVFHVPVQPAPSYLRADLKSKLAQRRLDSASQEPTIVPPIAENNKVTQLPSSLWITGAAAIIALALGLIVFLNSSPISENESLYEQLINADDTVQYSVTPETAENASGELLVSASGDEAVLRVASLPNVASDESYQLWLITDEQIHSGGIFYWNAEDEPFFVSITPDFVGDIVNVAMTIEPFAGSPLGNEPTGNLLFSVDVASQ